MLTNNDHHKCLLRGGYTTACLMNCVIGIAVKLNTQTYDKFSYKINTLIVYFFVGYSWF